MRQWALMAAALAVAGCWSRTSTPEESDASASGGDGGLGCHFDAATRQEVTALYELCDSSIGQLTAYDWTQTMLGRWLIVALVASSARADTSEAQEYLDDMLPDLELGEDGTWRAVGIGDDRVSSTLRIFEPGAREPTLLDVFDLDSYLAGAEVDASLSFDEMLEDIFRPCRFSVRFSGPGPLGRLLNDGEPIPGPFAVELSLSDIAWMHFTGAGEPNRLGPFASVLRLLEAESELVFADSQGTASIELVARGERISPQRFADEGLLRFYVPLFEARRGSMSMELASSALHVVHAGRLGGTMELDVEGTEPDVRIRTDFGSGNETDLPTTSWSCE